MEEDGGAMLGLHVLGYAAMAVRWAAGAGREMSSCLGVKGKDGGCGARAIEAALLPSALRMP